MLEAQGVTWEVARLDSFSIDPLELMRFDLIIMYGKSEFEPLSDVDAAVLEYWVLQGGGFMYSTFHPTDQSCDMVNSLPENFGISCVPGNQAVSGLGQPVFSHPVNNAVENVSVLGGEHWEVNHPAESIVQDNLGRPIVTATEWGFGRVVGINDEWPLYNTGTGNHDISAEDNGLMVDNALCWLLGDCNEAEVIGDFECDLSIDYVPSLGYNQIGLTDPCEGSFCGTHPVYGETRDIDDAVEYCQDICMNDNGCTGFFFQRHTNGHEICGFYSDGFELQGTSNGHQVGSRVCMKR
jgi:hypothetical protein